MLNKYGAHLVGEQDIYLLQIYYPSGGPGGHGAEFRQEHPDGDRTISFAGQHLRHYPSEQFTLLGGVYQLVRTIPGGDLEWWWGYPDRHEWALWDERGCILVN